MKEKNRFKVNNTYDAANDILLFEVDEDYDYKETIEIEDGVLLDFDVNNIPASLEIINASKILNVSKFSLKNISYFNMDVTITDKIINIDANIGVITHNKKDNQKIEGTIHNNYDIPAMKTELVVA